MPYLKTLAAAPALLAALSLAATPATAAELPLPAALPTYGGIVPVLDVEASQTLEHHRYHRHRYRYRRGPGLGDVLAGVLIVGAIAHVANAATRDDRRYRDRDYRRDGRWDDARGIDRAVGICVDAVERERRVETVDLVDRTARGWKVEGTISRGDGFTCRIDNDGRGVNVDLGGRGTRYDYDRDYDERDYDDREYDERYEDLEYDDDDRDFEDEREDQQWDENRYASEWSKVDRSAVAETAQAAETSYADDAEYGDAEIDGDLEIGTGYPGAGA